MADQMAGTWVTSFSALVYDDPQDSSDTPRIEAYEMHDGNRHRTAGYFFAATILCLKFDGAGAFEGKVDINRGGKPPPQNVVRGTYQIDPNPALGAFEGKIFAVYPQADPTRDVHMTYYFVVKDWDEIEWLRTTSEVAGLPFRHNIARGTLKRVKVHP